MNSVRAKFKVDSIHEDSWSKTVNMSAVYGTDGENKDFNSATPSGNLSIQIHGDVPASNFFDIGSEYYMDFSKSEKIVEV